MTPLQSGVARCYRAAHLQIADCCAMIAAYRCTGWRKNMTEIFHKPEEVLEACDYAESVELEFEAGHEMSFEMPVSKTQVKALLDQCDGVNAKMYASWGGDGDTLKVRISD